MESVLFAIGSFPVTAATALIGMAGFTLLVVIGFMVVFQGLRADGRRVASEGAAAAETLRQSYAAQKESFDKQVEYRDTRIVELERRLSESGASNTELRARLASAEERLESEKRQTGQQKQQAEENLKRYENARQQMTEQFKAVAGEILQTNSATFQKQNREQVDVLLKPLKDQIVSFQTQLTHDRATVGEQIRSLTEQSLRMQTETTNLTRALKGSSQTQGAWGEMILSTILERSGLREGEQYRTQQTHSGEDNQRLRTDVEILMPNADVLVIDSKVSLTAFEAFSSAEDGPERQQHLSAHIASIKAHVKTLGDKNYQRHAGSSLDFVMMFVPIEAALAEAVRADDRLIEQAISQGVMLTTPTTLMTVLRTVRNVWDIEKRHENAEKIADRAGLLYDKVMGFLSSMDGLGKNLDRAQKSFTDARGQLQDGRGSVVRQVEMLKELGAKTNRQMPAGWQAELGDETGATPLLEPAEDDE